MRTLAFIAVFVAMTLVSTATSPFLNWMPKVLGCRTNFDRSTFLAYCNTGDFADYEHGAFFWNLEPEAVKSLQAARVIFLGNSRTQHAFSAMATRQYFEERGVPYYIAGFSYGENMVFAQRLIEKYKLHPDAIVINSDDSFFSSIPKPIPATFLGSQTETLYWKTYYNYLLKATFSRIARPLCMQLPFVCAQKVQSLWRRRQTGDWDWQDSFVEKNYSHLPITPSMQEPAPNVQAMQAIESAAGMFLETMHLPRNCIILTAIPTSRLAAEPVAEQVGGRFHLPVIVPHLDNLSTIDYDHLDASSAERWAGTFLHMATPTLASCLAKRPPL